MYLMYDTSTNFLNGVAMKRLCVCSAAVACLAVPPMTMVVRAAQETRTNPDISGFWELNFDSRRVPRASLLPSVTRAKIDARAKGDAYAVRWCNLLGVPFVMDSGRPLDIRQGATTVIIAPENSSAPRRIPHGEIAAGRAIPPVEGWLASLGHVHLDRSHGLPHAALVRTSVSPAAGDLRAEAMAAPRSL